MTFIGDLQRETVERMAENTAQPEDTVEIMKNRYGEDCAKKFHAVPFGKTVDLGEGITLQFKPAGHVLGSAQVILEKAGFRSVVSGDYKTVSDNTCADFELIECDVFEHFQKRLWMFCARFRKKVG